MDITFTCSKCGQDLEVDESGAGLQVNCPKCQVALIVPHISSSATKLKETIRLSPFPLAAPAAPPSHAAGEPLVQKGASFYRLPGSTAVNGGAAPATARSTARPGGTTEPAHTVRAVVTEFDMPLGVMMKVALRWMVAALPAFLILLLIAVGVFKFLGLIIRQ